MEGLKTTWRRKGFRKDSVAQVNGHCNRLRENVGGVHQCSSDLLSALATSALLTTREERQKLKMVRTLSSVLGKPLLVHTQVQPKWGDCGQMGSHHSMVSCWSWPLHIPLHSFVAWLPQVFKHVFTLFVYLLDSTVSHLMDAPFTHINHFIGLFSGYCIFRVFKNTYGKYFHLVHGTLLIFLKHFTSKYTIRCCLGT